jgi:integrase
MDEIPQDIKDRLVRYGARPLVSNASAITWRMIYDKWLEYANIKLASTTVSRYAIAVTRLIGKEMDKPYRTHSSKELSWWMNDPDIAFGSRKNLRFAVISLYDFISNEGLCMGNPARNTVATWRDLTVDRIVPKVRPPYTHKEFETMLAHHRFTGFWNWGLQISYWMGLRRGDCVNLRFANFLENELQICISKTGDMLLLPYDHPQLGAGVIRKVKEEIFAHRPNALPHLTVFPIARSWANIRPHQMNDRFTRLCEIVGVRDLGWHSLRRACIQRCKDAGMSLKSIGKIVGHSATSTTFKYLNTPIMASELERDKYEYARRSK